MVNVNVCMSAFHEPQRNLADAYKDFMNRSKGAVPNFLTDKVKVTTTHLGYKKKKKIIGVGASAQKQTFDCSEYGGVISVQTYFSKSNFFLCHTV